MVSPEPNEHGDFLVGVLDTLIGFALALEASGALERADIVSAMDRVAAQQHARDGGNATAATQFAPMALRQFFSRPVVSSAVN